MPGKINTNTAKDTVKEITKEVHSLEPSAIISLYEIDISNIKKNLHLGSSLTIPEDYLRFHNNNAFGNNTIYFKNETYHAMPIITEGFEVDSGGSVPRPTLSFVSLKSINENVSKSNFSALKRAILELDNMIGAKVTRLRTFLKYLDNSNNINGVGQHVGTNPEFPREIYFVERKISENKQVIQLELSSVLDLENFKLPGRLCLANRCPFIYRGEGCAYEYSAAKNSTNLLMGSVNNQNNQKNTFGATAILPKFAPPIANDKNEKISSMISGYDPTNAHENIRGEYSPTLWYPAGDIVYVTKNNVKYYYVAKGDNNQPVPQGASPPNTNYWESDRCSKSLDGCKLRWGANGAAQEVTGNALRSPSNKFLMFGGYPGTNSKTVVQ